MARQATLNVAEIPTEQVKVTGMNPRKDFDKALLEELAQSIKQMGILEPLIVRQVKSGYELVSGERRLRAAKLAGLKTVPAWIREIADVEMQEIMLLENLQREDLTPLEEGMALQAMVALGATTHTLAERLGKSESWVRSRISLLMVPDGVKQMLADKKLPLSAAVDLIPFAGTALAESVAKSLAKRTADSEEGALEHTVVRKALDDLMSREGSVLNFTNMKDSYNWKAWTKKFDASECKKCKDKIKYTHRWHGTVEICLNKECFGPKVRDAKKKAKEAEDKKTDRKSKSGKVELQNVKHTMLDGRYVSFDKSVCIGCRHNVIGTYWGNEHNACLRPACAATMDKAAEREKEKRASKVDTEMKRLKDAYMKNLASRNSAIGIPRGILMLLLLENSSYNSDWDDITDDVKEMVPTLRPGHKGKGLKWLESLSDAELEIAVLGTMLHKASEDYDTDVQVDVIKVAPEIFGGIEVDITTPKFTPMYYEPGGKGAPEQIQDDDEEVEEEDADEEVDGDEEVDAEDDAEDAPENGCPGNCAKKGLEICGKCQDGEYFEAIDTIEPELATYKKATTYRGGPARRWSCPLCKKEFTRATSRDGETVDCPNCTRPLLLKMEAEA